MRTQRDPICGMSILESTPFQAEQGGKRYCFCSKGCQEKFIASSKENSRHYPLRTFISLTLLASLFLISALFPAWRAFHHSLLGYLKIVWWAVGLGLVLGGLIDQYVPKEYISYFLAGSSRKTILRAALLGFLLSACSHGILAISMALYKKGASAASTVTFLLASPWANLSVTFLLIGLFGAKGWLLILGALLVAIVTGFLFQELSRRNWVERNPNTIECVPNFSIRSDFKNRFWGRRWTPREWGKDIGGIGRSIAALSEMVLPWVVLGVILAGGASAWIPKTFLARFLGPTVLGLFVTLIVATVIETCSEGSSPLAFELYRSTGAFGNSFVFLMAGVITDYTEIGLLWTNIGKRTALWTVLLTIPQVLLIGFLLNLFFLV